MTTFCAVLFTTIQFSTTFVDGWSKASFTIDFKSTIFPLLQPPSAVITNFDLASSIRSDKAL